MTSQTPQTTPTSHEIMMAFVSLHIVTPRGAHTPRRQSLCLLDVVVQCLRFALHLSESVLHNVADRYDANEPLLFNHWHVAELARGHLLHNGVYGLGQSAGRFRTRHDARKWLFQHACASLGKRPHDITFR